MPLHTTIHKWLHCVVFQLALFSLPIYAKSRSTRRQHLRQATSSARELESGRSTHRPCFHRAPLEDSSIRRRGAYKYYAVWVGTRNLPQPGDFFIRNKKHHLKLHVLKNFNQNWLHVTERRDSKRPLESSKISSFVHDDGPIRLLLEIRLVHTPITHR